MFLFEICFEFKIKKAINVIIWFNHMISNIYNSAPTDGSRTDDLEILALHNNPHFIMQLDPLAIAETEHFGVI
jgi:hypothetical protein